MLRRGALGQDASVCALCQYRLAMRLGPSRHRAFSSTRRLRNNGQSSAANSLATGSRSVIGRRPVGPIGGGDGWGKPAFVNRPRGPSTTAPTAAPTAAPTEAPSAAPPAAPPRAPTQAPAQTPIRTPRPTPGWSRPQAPAPAATSVPLSPPAPPPAQAQSTTPTPTPAPTLTATAKPGAQAATTEVPRPSPTPAPAAAPRPAVRPRLMPTSGSWGAKANTQQGTTLSKYELLAHEKLLAARAQAQAEPPKPPDVRKPRVFFNSHRQLAAQQTLNNVLKDTEDVPLPQSTVRSGFFQSTESVDRPPKPHGPVPRRLPTLNADRQSMPTGAPSPTNQQQAGPSLPFPHIQRRTVEPVRASGTQGDPWGPPVTKKAVPATQMPTTPTRMSTTPTTSNVEKHKIASWGGIVKKPVERPETPTPQAETPTSTIAYSGIDRINSWGSFAREPPRRPETPTSQVSSTGTGKTDSWGTFTGRPTLKPATLSSEARALRPQTSATQPQMPAPAVSAAGADRANSWGAFAGQARRRPESSASHVSNTASTNIDSWGTFARRPVQRPNLHTPQPETQVSQSHKPAPTTGDAGAGSANSRSTFGRNVTPRMGSSTPQVSSVENWKDSSWGTFSGRPVRRPVAPAPQTETPEADKVDSSWGTLGRKDLQRAKNPATQVDTSNDGRTDSWSLRDRKADLGTDTWASTVGTENENPDEWGQLKRKSASEKSDTSTSWNQIEGAMLDNSSSESTPSPDSGKSYDNDIQFKRKPAAPEEATSKTTEDQVLSHLDVEREIPAVDSAKAHRFEIKPEKPEHKGKELDKREAQILEERKARKERKAKRSGRRSMYEDEDDDYVDEDYEYEERRRLKAERKARKAAKEVGPTPIRLPELIGITALADALKVKHDLFLQQLGELGFENVTLDSLMAGETAALVAQEYGFEPTVDLGASRDLKPRPPPTDPSALPPRPPVVTIMGHVDHGKTTLLDYLRKSSVAAQEHGGITQHIGAFSVSLSSGKVMTFLDTPGHAAFLTMRERGAQVTDIVVLVVAGDDSVKPQTLEALKHAHAHNVPIIVAITKIDKGGVDISRVKADLGSHGVEIEDMGGDVQVVLVSGKTGRGMEDLEENILTLSEIIDMRAEKDGMAEGWVLESSLKPIGKTATVLVKRGTLRPGDFIAAGLTWAKIRHMRNEAGALLSEAPPGTPVEILGWKELPAAGDQVLQGEDEDRVKDAVSYRETLHEQEKAAADHDAIAEARRQHQEKRARERAAIEASGLNASVGGNWNSRKAAQHNLAKQQAIEAAAAAAADMEDTNAESEGVAKMVNFVVKADVHGSVEAVSAAIQELGNHEVRPRVLRSAAGPITEFDVEHAAASGSILINFSTTTPGHITHMAEEQGVTILEHNIIYGVVEDVIAVLNRHLAPEVTSRVLAEAEVLQIFPINIHGRKYKNIAGCRVRTGTVTNTPLYRVVRGQETVFSGKLETLKHHKKDITEMRKGGECGLGFLDFQDFEVGDVIQAYEEVRTPRTLPVPTT